MRRRCLTVFFILILCFFFGQEPSYRELSTEQGLPSRTIYDINQRKNGKIVIGHELGLSVYNGMEVCHYQNNYKTTPLSNLTLYKNEILCRNFYNEVYLTQKNNIVKRLESLSGQDAGICSIINFKNKIYKKTNNEIIEFGFDKEIENFKQIFNSTETIIDFKLQNDTMYVLTMMRFLYFNIHQPTKIKSKKFESGKMPRIFLLNKKIALYCPDFKMITVNPHHQKPKIIALQDFNINDKSTCVRQLKDGNIYIGTFGGLYIYNSSGDLLQNCYKDVQISNIFQDEESNIWLGTLQDGIRIISNVEIQTVQLKVNEKISKIKLADDSTLFIGTYDGKLYRYTLNEEKKLIYDFNRNNEIQSIFSNKSSIWAFCSDLVEFNLESYKVKQEFSPYPVKCIAKMGDTLFCGTSKGLQLVVDNKVVKSIHRELWVKNVVVKHKKIFFETSKGIYLYENGVLRPYRIQFKDSKLTLVNATNLIESDGSIYFSLKNCVYHVDRNNKVSQYQCSESLKSITKIAVAKGQIFATDGKVILELTHQKVIDKSKGVQIIEIMDIIGWDEKLIIVGKNQFQIFPIYYKRQFSPQTLHLIDVSGTFKNQKNSLQSDYKSNNLLMRFEYLPNITSVGTGAVFYRIKGVSDDWKKMEYKTGGFRIDERRLPFGKLTLEVYAVDSNQNQTKTHYFSLFISPPFYFTWWFIILCIVTISLIVWRVYKHRIFLINRKNDSRIEQEQLKTKLISSELKALRSQMNPHFIFNSLSAIQSKILNDETKDAYTNLSAFSKLLRQSLKFTGQEFISLEDELDFLKNYMSLEQTRMDGRFEVKFEIDSKINLKEAQFPSLFSQPFVENAIRHGLIHSKNVKKLKIKLTGNTHRFDFIIEDNGIGRKAANTITAVKNKSHESFATNAMQERIHLINTNGSYSASLKIEDLEKGTRIIITIQTNL